MVFDLEAKTLQIGDFGSWKCKASNQGFSYSDGGEAGKTMHSDTGFMEILLKILREMERFRPCIVVCLMYRNCRI